MDDIENSLALKCAYAENNQLSAVEIERIKTVYRGLSAKSKNMDILNSAEILTLQFRDMVVPYPDGLSFGIVTLLSAGMGNCLPTAVLALSLLTELGYGARFSCILEEFKYSSVNHAFLWDELMKIRYDFTIDPFVMRNFSLQRNMRTLDEDTIVKYFVRLGQIK